MGRDFDKRRLKNVDTVTATERKNKIKNALEGFGQSSFSSAALSLLEVLGYKTERLQEFDPPTIETVYRDLPNTDVLRNTQYAKADEWAEIPFVMQLAGDDLQASLQRFLPFIDTSQLNFQEEDSYLFWAIRLKSEKYTRTDLAGMTRAVNRLYPIPVMVLFQHGNRLSIGIVLRTSGKRNPKQDKLDKVTLIRDIDWHDPLRAHLDILYDLALPTLHESHGFATFAQLHKAWEKQLDTYELNKTFYREVVSWYYWVLNHPQVRFPRDVRDADQKSMFVIRLLTRLIFCWFLREKTLIPANLFRKDRVLPLLDESQSNESAGGYYQAILQNLFFGTLNQSAEERGFRKKVNGRYNDDYGATNKYRYEEFFKDEQTRQQFREWLKQVPFVNGGLFDCLDEPMTQKDEKVTIRLDDFSDQKNNPLCLPNELFFSGRQTHNMVGFYDDNRRTAEPVWGIIEIFERYKFTVEENTPLEEEIALDPELLGQMFENLLASFNTDTRTTARKATGSFYTPRVVVDFMVDESLLLYLSNPDHVPSDQPQSPLLSRLRTLFSQSTIPESLFTEQERTAIVAAIDKVKIIDPACGTGAFLIGALRRLVELLQRIDPENQRWEALQRQHALRETESAFQLGTQSARQERLDDINEVFTRNTENYGRKLYLIENSIYGIDIQPIACQIAKLRVFISLLVDQKVEPTAPNQGVRVLPNLETRIVAANTLIPIQRQTGENLSLADWQVHDLRKQLESVRHDYFLADNPTKKRKVRETDAKLREQITKVLQQGGFSSDNARIMASWDPYNQNAHAEFFDSAWMFGIPIGRVRTADSPPKTLRGQFALLNEAGGQLQLTPDDSVESGFDIVLGNPPYVRQERITEPKPLLRSYYEVFSGTADLYVYFYQASIRLLKPGGVFAFITSNKWYRSRYGENLRKWIVENTRLMTLIDFDDEKIFEAIAFPTIVILKRDTHTNKEPDHRFHSLNWEKGWEVKELPTIVHDHAFTMPQSVLQAEGWQFERSSVLILLGQIRNQGVPLGKYVNNKLYYGIKTGLNDAFIVDRATRDRLIAEDPSSKDILKPYLRGKDIKRWESHWAGLYIIFTRRGINIEKYPSIEKHLRQWKNDLTPKESTTDKQGRKPGRYQWFEIQDDIAYYREFERKKITWGNLATQPQFAIADAGIYINAPANIIVAEEPILKYLLGILNSQITEFFIGSIGATRQGGFIEYKPMYVSQMPIPQASLTEQSIIISLVDYILNITNHAKDRMITQLGYLEQLLNGLVYELFFPEELHKNNFYLFRHLEQAQLPKSQNISEIEAVVQTLYDRNHPVRGTLFSLQSLEIVRIIEGKA